MMLSSKFQEIFLLHQNQAKTRNQNLRPELTTSSTKGILILNPAARKMMELGLRDRVLVFDVKQDASSNQDRFYLTKGFVYEKKAYGNKINANGGFMDASFYNLLISNDFAIDHCSNDDLLRLGLFIRRSTAKRQDVLTPVKKVTGEIRPYTETQSDGTILDKLSIAPGMPSQPVYLLTSIVWTDNPLLD